MVGIDGSDAAIRAAEWAVDEALSRDISLRLLHVVEGASEDIGLEVEFAETALRAANATAAATAKPVRVDTAVIRGPVDATFHSSKPTIPSAKTVSSTSVPGLTELR